MEDTFEKALARLFTEAPPAITPPAQPTPTPRPSPSPGTTAAPTAAPTLAGTPSPAQVAQLVREASEQFAAAQDALRAGDFAEYGRRIKLLEETLARLRIATGQ